LGRGQRFFNVCVEILPSLGTYQIDLLTPLEQLAAVDFERTHALARTPRRKCMRRMATAAGVTPGMRLACPSEIGRTKLSFSTISRDRPGRRYDISRGMRSSSSS